MFNCFHLKLSLFSIFVFGDICLNFEISSITKVHLVESIIKSYVVSRCWKTKSSLPPFQPSDLLTVCELCPIRDDKLPGKRLTLVHFSYTMEGRGKLIGGKLDSSNMRLVCKLFLFKIRKNKWPLIKIKILLMFLIFICPHICIILYGIYMSIFIFFETELKFMVLLASKYHWYMYILSVYLK